jgi:tetratricopeptide (TPR) repeat protein
VGVGVDVERGEMKGGVCGDRPVDRHPDSGLPFEGRLVPQWDRCLEIARSAAGAAGVDYVGVDIVVDARRGPMVLEINARPGLAIQIANREPQPVRARTVPGRLDRVTMLTAFAVLGALTVAPLLAPVWAPPEPTELLAVGRAVPAAVAQESRGLAQQSGEEWDDEEMPLSLHHELFALATNATERGDTATALSLYEQATQDSSVAPFALNNIALIHRRRGETELARSVLGEALQRFPRYSRGHYNRGIAHRDLGRPDSALTSFRAAIAIRPSHAKSWARIGDLLFDQREFEASAEAYQEAIRFAPSATSHRLRLGLCVRLLDDFDRAADHFGAILALEPENDAAAYWWARSVRDSRRAGGAVGAAVSADSLASVLRPHVKSENPSWRCRSVLAMARWDRGDRVRALREFDRIRRRSDDGADAARSAALIALDLGLWKRAESLGRKSGDSRLTRAVRQFCRLGEDLDSPLAKREGAARSDRKPGEAAWAAEREVLRHVILGNGEDARTVLRSLSDPETEPWLAWIAAASETDPLDAEANIPSFEDRLEISTRVPESLRLWSVFRIAEDRGLSDVAVRALSQLDASWPGFRPRLLQRFQNATVDGRTAEALRIGDRLLDLDRNDDATRMALVSLFLDRGDSESARALMGDLPESLGASPEVTMLEGRLLVAEGQIRKGLALLRGLLGRTPQEVDVRFALARAHMASGQISKAIAQLEEASAADPGRLDVRRLLARQYASRKDYTKAVEQWERVNRLSENQLSDRFQFALCLQRADRPEEAVREYDQVLKQDPERYKAWFNRSLALEKVGRRKEAMAGYERVLDLHPDHEASRTKLSQLRSPR